MPFARSTLADKAFWMTPKGVPGIPLCFFIELEFGPE